MFSQEHLLNVIRPPPTYHRPPSPKPLSQSLRIHHQQNEPLLSGLVALDTHTTLGSLQNTTSLRPATTVSLATSSVASSSATTTTSTTSSSATTTSTASSASSVPPTIINNPAVINEIIEKANSEAMKKKKKKLWSEDPKVRSQEMQYLVSQLNSIYKEFNGVFHALGWSLNGVSCGGTSTTTTSTTSTSTKPKSAASHKRKSIDLTPVELAQSQSELKRQLREKDIKKPKNPISGYNLFCNDLRKAFADRPELLDEETKSSSQNVMKLLALKWKELPETMKNFYQQRYVEARKLYTEQMEEYKKAVITEIGMTEVEYETYNKRVVNKKVKKQSPPTLFASLPMENLQLWTEQLPQQQLQLQYQHQFQQQQQQLLNQSQQEQAQLQQQQAQRFHLQDDSDDEHDCQEEGGEEENGGEKQGPVEFVLSKMGNSPQAYPPTPSISSQTLPVEQPMGMTDANHPGMNLLASLGGYVQQPDASAFYAAHFQQQQHEQQQQQQQQQQHHQQFIPNIAFHPYQTVAYNAPTYYIATTPANQFPNQDQSTTSSQQTLPSSTNGTTTPPLGTMHNPSTGAPTPEFETSNLPSNQQQQTYFYHPATAAYYQQQQQQFSTQFQASQGQH